MAGRPKRRARLAAGTPATPQNTPASGIPSGGPAQGYVHRPPSGDLATAGGKPDAAHITRTHGARTPRVYGELARELAAGLTAERPDLDRYPEAVAAWATAEAQAALIREHLEDVGPIDPASAEPRTSVLDLLSRTEKRAEAARSRLGLDPRSEASLARERATAATLSVDLGELAARGRAVLADATRTAAAVRVLPAGGSEGEAS